MTKSESKLVCHFDQIYVQIHFFPPQIQPELITLDPNKIGEVDRVTFQQREEDRRVLFVSLFYLLYLFSS